jgi:hypothetical protein
MKKISIKAIKLITISLFTIIFSTNAYSDASLVKVGGGANINLAKLTMEDSDGNIISKTNTSLYTAGFAKIENGFPLIPNLRYDLYSVAGKYSDQKDHYNLKQTRFLMYSGFSIAMVQINYGVAQNSLEVKTTDDGKIYPISAISGYAGVIVDIPLFPLTPKVEYNMAPGVEKGLTVVTLTLSMNLFPGLYLDFGEKISQYNLKLEEDGNETTTKFNSFFIGASFNLGL